MVVMTGIAFLGWYALATAIALAVLLVIVEGFDRELSLLQSVAVIVTVIVATFTVVYLYS